MENYRLTQDQVDRIPESAVARINEKAEEYAFHQAKRRHQEWVATRVLAEDHEAKLFSLEWKYIRLQEDYEKFKTFQIICWGSVLVIQIAILVLRVMCGR